MTTAIIHGDPGSFKTSSLVSDYLVPAVKEGRLIITNIRGIISLEEISDLYGFELPDTAEIMQVPFDQNGFEQMARFFHWAPHGAIILMDEGQRVYPTRLRDFKGFDLISNDDSRPKTVEDAFDSHRHMNWDIYISTTNISKIHKEIRAVAEFGFRHKNLATVFSFLKGRYKRVTHNAENSGSAIGHAISSTVRKIDARCFNVYQSTATGQTKDSSSGFSFFKQPKVALLLLVIGYSVWNLGSTYLGSDSLPPLFGGALQSPVGQVVPPTPAPLVKASAANASGDVSLREIANPLFRSQWAIVGEINGVLLFEIADADGNFLTMPETHVAQLGARFTRLGVNMVRMTYGDQTMLIMQKQTIAHYSYAESLPKITGQ